jgi:hypothetical protein
MIHLEERSCQTIDDRSSTSRLAPVFCTLCGHPVSHMDPTVARAVAGGMCTHCKKDKNGDRERVFTFIRYVEKPDQ